MIPPITFTVPEELEGLTAEQVLKTRLHLSGALLRSLKFRPDGIRVNGVRARSSTVLRAGDILTLPREDSPARVKKLLPYAGPQIPPLTVCYEDAFLLAVDKPAGLAVHPAGGHRQDTLANLLQDYLDRTDPGARVHLLGRLDKDTSGLVLCAKNEQTAHRLQREKAREGFGKTYLALAAGEFAADGKEHCISIPLKPVRDPDTRIERLMPAADGSPAGDDTRVSHEPPVSAPPAPGVLSALTRFTVEQTFPGYALLKLRLSSGRMHQIRAHLAAVGRPLLGDPLYGDPAVNRLFSGQIRRSALHAAEISFPHLETGEAVTLSSPLPPDMASLLHDGSAAQ